MVIQSALNSLGSTAVAAFTAGSKIDQFATQPLASLGVAVATYTAQNYGAGNSYRIRKGYRISFIIIALWGLLVTAAFVFFPTPISRLFFHEADAIATAVDYLIRQGHRKIAVLGGSVTSYPSLMRRQGAQQAMEDAGIVFNDKLYGLSNYDFESAYHAMNSLLARRAEFTALFAMSDVIAFGAIRALVSAGLRVPEDVSVIGFDGITMSRYCVPVMTTIVQPSEQIALQSIELLVRQIEHGSPAQTVTLQPELQQGESVRAI